MTYTRPTLESTLALAVLMTVLPLRLCAQSVAGTVREDDARAAPLAGAFVSLLDAGGEQVDAGFTTPDGAFRLEAPSPGSYRIRVQRIGYANWESEPVTLASGRTGSVDIRIPLDPIALADLDVTVVRGCVRDPEQAGALADVWEEARKALETAVWAEGRDELRFSLAEYRRRLEPGTLAERTRESSRRANVPLPPFESLPASRLAADGFASFHEDTTIYYLPDATALLSPEFRGTHCFGLERERHEGETRLGVTFEPRPGRPVPEIEGTMWLSQETGELRLLEFRYVNVPMLRGVERRHLAGEVEFARLPNGPFYVREWWVRVPITGRTLLQIPGSGPVGDPRRQVLAGYLEMGGTVTGAFLGGRSVFAQAGVTVTGAVRDPATGEPVPGVTVSLRDWERASRFVVEPDPSSLYLTAVTDSAGRFEIPGVEDGTYAARLDDPRWRWLGIRPVERLVTVGEDEPATLELAGLSREDVFRRLCPGVPLYRAEGAIVGFLLDTATGEAIPGAEVEVRWGETDLRVSGGHAIVSEDARFVVGITDAEGRFTLCGVPAGESLLLRRTGDRLGEALTLDDRIVIKDLYVRDPGDPVGEAPAGAGEPAPPDTADAALEAAVETLRAGIDRSGAPLTAGDVAGTVVSAETRAPIAGARIRDVAGTAEAVSGEDGGFRLRRLPAGTRTLEIEHIAYGTSQADVEVRYAEATVVELRLVPRAIEVEPLGVEITGFRDLRLESKGFYERREMGEELGLGSFYTAEEIGRRNPQRISHIAADSQGVEIRCDGAATGPQTCHLRLLRTPRSCPLGMDVYVNGVRAIAGDGTEFASLTIDQLVIPSEVSAMEVYTGAATLPAGFGGASGQCGAVVIWTK